MPTDDDQHDRSPTAPDGGTAPGADPLVGCALGDFDVLERLAGGPVHAIYRARQRSTGREVALKVLAEALSGSDVAVVGFEAEAAAAAAVSHPRVAAVAGWGCESGRHFIVIELVEGESLAEALARRGCFAFSSICCSSSSGIGCPFAKRTSRAGVRPRTARIGPVGGRGYAFLRPASILSRSRIASRCSRLKSASPSTCRTFRPIFGEST